ncbi:Pol protein [Phytophthora palmivora]|uniref:Pol protein n=1 Tax=Phytophthora palmivora TaxID=4796 RepID=A0A2P4YLI4_9STRA|nr:Pol protein [Phytophthora palmivora]
MPSFAKKAKAGVVQESKSPHSTPTFCCGGTDADAETTQGYVAENMSRSTLYSALDLVDGYYQILKWESDIPLTAMSTTSVRSDGYGGALEALPWIMKLRRTRFSAALSAGSAYTPIQGRPEPCGLADPKFTEGPPEVKDADWVWEKQRQDAFDGIKASLQHAPVLALPDENMSFSVNDVEEHECVISFQARQLKAAERNYPVHDKELLAMKYALVKFRVHLLGTRPFVIYTDHASLRTVTNSPHLLQRMARWLSFFAEYNFRVEYKPGKLNVLADALSRRPDYELAHVSRVTTDLYDRLRFAYQGDENYTPLVRFLSGGKDVKVERLSPRQQAQLHRYELADGLLHYRVDPGDPP